MIFTISYLCEYITNFKIFFIKIMNQNFGKNIYFYSSFLVIFALILIVNSLLPLWTQNKNLEMQLKKLQQKNITMKKEKVEYQKKIYALKNNPAYIEFMIREKMKYGKLGECVDY